MLAVTINEYLTEKNTLTPTDLQVGAAVVASDWWSGLKDNFDDLAWLYYSDRIVFINERYGSSDIDNNYNNIIKTFAIWIKSKKQLIDRLYVGYMSEFNPLWNVDGVTGTISKDSHSGDNSDKHTGHDKTSYEDNGSTVRNGSEEIASEGDDVSKNDATTFDSGDAYFNVDKSTLTHGKTDTHTYNNIEDEKDLDGFQDTVYDSTLKHEFNEINEHMDLQIRQGNIGVTQSDKILKDAQLLYMDDIMDLWKWIVRMCVNQVSYTVEGF